MDWSEVDAVWEEVNMDLKEADVLEEVDAVSKY